MACNLKLFSSFLEKEKTGSESTKREPYYWKSLIEQSRENSQVHIQVINSLSYDIPICQHLRWIKYADQVSVSNMVMELSEATITQDGISEYSSQAVLLVNKRCCD